MQPFKRISNDKAKFEARVKIAPETECWIWTGTRDSNGYGLVNLPDRYRTTAHRVSYELYVGPIPDGMVIDHLCKNPQCVNPAHLEPVTNYENSVARATGHCHDRSVQTHCKRGHPLSGENVTRYGKFQTRCCMTCKRARDRARSKTNREPGAVAP